MEIGNLVAGDTIVAISTPAGRGGIGIVRLSGSRAREIAEGLVRLKKPLDAGQARFALVLDADGDAVLDEAVVTFFKGPRSYTGEDVVEVAAHGAPVLLDQLVRRCVAAGARLAGPGEFTERAFLAGRIDLTQAEAVDDLIQATTLEQARTAARQMGGGLSRQVRPVKERLIALIAGLEAGIDFAEDDLEVIATEVILTAVREIKAPLAALEESFAYGRMLREGFKLAIVGRPNAGKSSLFNRLVRRDRAIVTAQPGTTRDTVIERLEFAGIPAELVDTAGLRGATAAGRALDEAETIGVARSRESMAEADVVLLVVAADTELGAEDWEVIQRFGGAAGAPVGDAIAGSSAALVVVLNKMDLVKENVASREERERLLFGRGGGGEFYRDVNWGGGERHDEGAAYSSGLVVETSAVNGTGIEELRAVVLSKLRAIAPQADTAPVTNLRQHLAVTAAVGALKAAAVGAEQQMPHEMVLLDLHEALEALDQLTGTTHTEEILSLIFSTFCIGK